MQQFFQTGKSHFITNFFSPNIFCCNNLQDDEKVWKSLILFAKVSGRETGGRGTGCRWPRNCSGENGTRTTWSAARSPGLRLRNLELSARHPRHGSIGPIRPIRPHGSPKAADRLQNFGKNFKKFTFGSGF